MAIPLNPRVHVLIVVHSYAHVCNVISVIRISSYICLQKLLFVSDKLVVVHNFKGINSASNRNEYQVYFLEVKAAGA